MPSLLSNSQKDRIRRALRDVTDTFMVTPIRYHIAGLSLDRWGEDQEGEQFVDAEFEVLEEAITEDNEVVEMVQGSRDLAEVKLSANLEVLEEKNLITSDFKTVFNAARDFLTLRGQVYKVIDIYFDGPLDFKNVLVVIEAKLDKDAIIPQNNPSVGNNLPVDEILSGNLSGQLTQLTQRVTAIEGDDIIPIEDLPELGT